MPDDLRKWFDDYERIPLGPGDRPTAEALRRRGRRWQWRRRGGAVLVSAAIVGGGLIGGRFLPADWWPSPTAVEVVTPPTSTSASPSTATGVVTTVPPSTQVGSTSSTQAPPTAPSTSTAPPATTRPAPSTAAPTTTRPFIKQAFEILRPAADATLQEATPVTVTGRGCYPSSSVAIGLLLDGSSYAEPIGRGKAGPDGVFSVTARIPEFGGGVPAGTRLQAACDGQTASIPISIQETG
jgi:hypothetical protein